MRLATLPLAFVLAAVWTFARTTLVAPSAYPGLPPSLAADLQRRGCSIPEPEKHSHQNAIQGEFFQAGQSGWAVLCATQQTTELLAFPNGSQTQAVVAIAMPNSFKSWTIAAVPPASLTQLAPARLLPVNHQGLRSTIKFGAPHCEQTYCFSEQSKVLYWDGGQWVPLRTTIAD
jgi:hypothetical protein